uniref:Uncharacterized protein n=1 Tax=Plectus sambesii TaxID=2011161 RepID=A0A914UXR5_9BILA
MKKRRRTRRCHTQSCSRRGAGWCSLADDGYERAQVMRVQLSSTNDRPSVCRFPRGAKDPWVPRDPRLVHRSAAPRARRINPSVPACQPTDPHAATDYAKKSCSRACPL